MISAHVADTGFFDVTLPDGRELIDLNGADLANLADLYRCPVEVIMPAPRVMFIPMKPTSDV